MVSLLVFDRTSARLLGGRRLDLAPHSHQTTREESDAQRGRHPSGPRCVRGALNMHRLGAIHRVTWRFVSQLWVAVRAFAAGRPRVLHIWEGSGRRAHLGCRVVVALFDSGFAFSGAEVNYVAVCAVREGRGVIP